MPLKTIGFNDFYFRLVGIPIVALLIPPIFFQVTMNMPNYGHKVAFSLFYCTLHWHVCRFIILRTNALYPNLGENKKRLWIIFLGCVGFIFVFIDVIQFCAESYFHQQDDIPPMLQVNSASFVTALIVITLYESMRYLNLWKKTALENENLIKVNLQSQLEGLKNQVNPHFLFNSLNTLVHIIPEQPETAVRFVKKMSNVYRYILEMKDENTTPLHNELKFLIAYAFLLKERFGESLKIHLADIAEYHDHQIVSLAMQIVLENAIKHNVVSIEKPLKIEIFVEDNDKLVVRNNLQLKNQKQVGTGTGIQNIKHRYELICNRPVEISVTQEFFTVKLPLIEQSTINIKQSEISLVEKHED